MQSKFNTGNPNDIDPTSGWVNYRSPADAKDLGLISTKDGDVYLGVDHSTVGTGSKGRSSVRVQSKANFNHGLFISKFSHLPKPVCGSWPAYWMVGNSWPDDGEIDIYENWNMPTSNMITLHTLGTLAQCTLNPLDFSNPVTTPNCDNYGKGQFTNQGCGTTELGGQWGSADGGVCMSDLGRDAVEPC